MSHKIDIIECSIDDIATLLRQIPEFDFRSLPFQEEKLALIERLEPVESLLLMAKVNGQPVGFKVGYKRWNNGSFYSWLGGVLPNYRRMGVAKALAQKQEDWVKKKGYQSIIFKTRNRFANMLLFGINNGFNIIKVTKAATIADYRIYLQKFLR